MQVVVVQYGAASVVQKQKVEDKVVREDAQEAASIPDAISNNDDTDDLMMIAKKNDDESNNNFSGHKKFSQIWNITDEPAPQWLIEEALKRGDRNNGINQFSNAEERRNDSDDNLVLNIDRENIIFDLEKELATIRAELAEALNEQSIIRNRYKKALKNVQIAANEEREELQRKLVQICTSILQKFGPDALSDKTVKTSNKKRYRPVQYFGMLSRKFHRKLRIATLTSSKLKQEVIALRKELTVKSQRYDCLVKCLDGLKIELKNRDSNLNDLINENATLRKRVDDARDWMQMKVSKERHEKINAAQFREIQRGRELANLKKKSEEDLSTIAQLRAKLLRSESANTNKGFLLNNYKSQLSDLTKDKEKLSTKIKELENENTSLRNGNIQLRSNLTLVNGEKEKLRMELDKSEIEMRERIQSKLAMKYERSMLQRIDAIRANYDKSTEALDTKLKLSENSISQYFGSIKRYFKEIHDYHRELDAERDLCSSEASEREAHETACEILNITRGELTGFLKGRPGNAINSWLSAVQRITAKKHFADELGKFLFARAIGSSTN